MRSLLRSWSMCPQTTWQWSKYQPTVRNGQDNSGTGWNIRFLPIHNQKEISNKKGKFMPTSIKNRLKIANEWTPKYSISNILWTSFVTNEQKQCKQRKDINHHKYTTAAVSKYPSTPSSYDKILLKADYTSI